MATLDFSKLSSVQGVEPVDTSMVDLVFQLNVSQAQLNSGIVGKVIIHHPAFVTRATLFKSPNGAIRVAGSSIKSGENGWFNIVTLEPGFRDFIVNEYLKEIAGERDSTPWYIKMQGEHSKVVNGELENESLDIKNIIIMTNLSEKQIQSNMLCKATIVTSVATIRSFSIYKSQFGKQLYGQAQTEDADNTIPAYTLSRECEAQVLNLIHPLVTNWDETYERKKDNTVNASIENAVENGDVTVNQDDMPAFDSALYQ